jgi:hypothetical protein
MTVADRTAILNALKAASDHLPVVADYDIVGLTPEPGAMGLLILGGAWLLRRRWGGGTFWRRAQVGQPGSLESYSDCQQSLPPAKANPRQA